jgi:hypothetical protein
MSASLPTLFTHANGYRRQLTFTPTGVMAEEISDDAAHDGARDDGPLMGWTERIPRRGVEAGTDSSLSTLDRRPGLSA